MHSLAEMFGEERITIMLPSFPTIFALSIPLSQSSASTQSRALAYSTQVTVQVTVAREPRPKQADEKAPTTPAAPMPPLVSRSFTGQVALKPPGSALITVNDEKRIERQRLTINPQTAVLWQAVINW